MSKRTVLLIHGGLYEPMGAEQFWVEPGVVEAVEANGLRVLAPDRLASPKSWQDEAALLANILASSGVESVTVVAGSNGCSAALRLSLDFPNLVKDLVLCWPVTVTTRNSGSPLWKLIASKSGDGAARSLLDGETIRGISDDELKSVAVPVGIMAAEPENLIHQRKTVHDLLELMPDSRPLPAFPETPRPDFSPCLDDFVAAILG